MSQSKFEIVDVETVLDLRHRVLWPDRPLSHVRVPDDDHAIHICARHAGKVIAVGSFFLSDKSAQLRKLAVEPDHRGKGLGRGIIAFGADLVAGKGVQTLWCDARADAVGFYRAQGFSVAQDVYLKSGVQYRRATIRLPLQAA